jgi:spore maturation protein CgeB
MVGAALVDAMTPDLVLQKNLAALAARDRALAERLCGPVDDSHVDAGDSGGGHVRLRVHHSWLPLALSPAEIETALRPLSVQAGGAGIADPIFIFGAGAGDLPDRALAVARQQRVTVWDRDPFLLRLALSRHDWSEPLASGRLVLALGCDLFAQLGPLAAARLVLHPLLSQVYRNERALLMAAPHRRALVCAGGLFVDDLADALRDDGYAVYTLDASRLAIEELTLTVQVTSPALVAAVNYTEGLAEFCESAGVPLLCWEVDPTLQRLSPVAPAPVHSRIFTYRRAHVADYVQAGFPNVEFLPLASNPKRRAPVELPAPEAQEFAVPVAFVGASLVDRVPSLRDDFVRAFLAFKAGVPAGVRPHPARDDDSADGIRLLDEVLARQRRDPSRWLIPGLLEQLAPGLREHGKRPGAFDAEQIAGEIAAGEKRIALVGAVADGLRRAGGEDDSGQPQVHVWGDAGWQSATTTARYRGVAGHFVELNKIYGSARINLDIGRLYQMDIVTMRVFDVLACGGFLLTERSAELCELFEPGQDLDVFTGADELLEKCRYYLDRPELAARIAAQGRATVLARHTVAERVARMLATLG